LGGAGFHDIFFAILMGLELILLAILDNYTEIKNYKKS
jgi:hypothetical protein